MSRVAPVGTHLVVGGFPPGSPAGHDMAYVRRRLLDLLAEHERVQPSVSGDFADVAKWLPATGFLVTYTAGPYPDDAQHAAIRDWLDAGGRWLGLHGTSGGRAASIDGDRRRRRMVKLDHHATLGGFFLNHPPVRRFTVEVAAVDHPLAAGLPARWETDDELYLVEVLDPDCDVLLTTDLPTDPSPPGFGFEYAADTALAADGRTRVLGYTRAQGAGAVAYIALGHCHSPETNTQPFFDASAVADGTTPLTFRGSWETDEFTTLLRNGIAWGLEER